MLDDRSSSIHPRKRQSPKVVSNAQQTKQANSYRKGKLAGMLSLPIEIITEVATHLTPPDLIILSRLTKDFRALLMRRSAAPIWASAIQNVPRLPNCPDDLCEAQYAALVYSKYCSTCGIGVTKQMDPYLNVRLCNSCRAEQVISVEEAPNELVKILVPQTPSRGDDSEPVCLRSDLEELTRYELHLPDSDDLVHPDDEAWLRSKTRFLLERIKYAQNLESFLEKLAKDRTQKLETLKSQRRDDIKQRLESAGWNKRDWLFPLEVAEKWVKLAEAPKPLTDRTWESMYPKLVPYLEANRKQYLERAPQDRYRRRERRLRALLVGIKKKDIVFKVERSVLKAQAGGSTTPDDIASFTESDQDECESEDDWPHNQPIALSVFALRLPFPPMVEIFKFPSILPLVENDVDAGSLEILFDEARADLQEAIQSWRWKVEGELLGVLQAGVKTTPCSDLVLNFSLPPKYAGAISDLSPLLHTLLRADTVFRVIDDRIIVTGIFCRGEDADPGLVVPGARVT
ncbi:hypothetical protein FRC09_002799 [Ceratobasidium sp. 395]|nr:hypothetical protein FRC09_002799 [Ceratobasidium sp. 395]